MKLLYKSVCRTLQQKILSWSQIFLTTLEGQWCIVYLYFVVCLVFKSLKFHTDRPAVKTTKLLYLFLFSSQLHVARAFESTVYKC